MGRQIKRCVKRRDELEPIKITKAKAKDHVLNDEIIKGIAQRLNLDYDVVRAVVRSQWDFLHEVIREDKFYSLRVKFLGTFGVKNWRFKYSKHKELFVKEEERIRGVKPELLRAEKNRKDPSEDIGYYD